MDNQSKDDRPSPLRNTKAANRPFQSPLRSVLTIIPHDKIDGNNKQGRNSTLVDSSPKTLTTSEKRMSRQPLLSAKKICQEIKDSDFETGKEGSINEVELKQVKERISLKKKELKHVKQQLLYEKKHDANELNNLMKRWLQGCQEALTQFQKDISIRNGAAVSMIEILKQLGIPAELVEYSVENSDFV